MAKFESERVIIVSSDPSIGGEEIEGYGIPSFLRIKEDGILFCFPLLGELIETR